MSGRPRQTTALPAAAQAGPECLCGRDSCEGDCAAAVSERPLLSEPGDAWWSRVSTLPEMTWLVGDLVPEDGIHLWHGRPRAIKSLSYLDMMLSATLGEPHAFHNERFRITRPLRWAYFTEEDSDRLLRARFQWLFARRDLPSLPAGLLIESRRGLSWENRDDQERLLLALRRARVDVATFDPVRGFTPNADKGPADFHQAQRFLRRMQNECPALGLIHHDTKPPRVGTDQRSPSDQASGGGLLSTADCPVQFVREDSKRARTVATPDRYKPGNDPAAFVLSFKSACEDGGSFRDWLDLTASDTTPAQEQASALEQKVLAVLAAARDGATANECVETVGKRRAAVLKVLKQLLEAGKVQNQPRDKGGDLWYLRPPKADVA